MKKYLLVACLCLATLLIFTLGNSFAHSSYGSEVNAFCDSNPYTGDCTLCHNGAKSNPTTAKSQYLAGNLCYFCPNDPVCSAPPPPPPPTCTDADGDGFSIEGGACGQVDCKDTDASIFPGATEICTDGKDNDCDGLVDANDPNAVGCPAPPPTCTDSDGDGFAIEGGACGQVDCKDTDASIFPGALEICTDGKDNDCDGLVDANDPNAVGCETPPTPTPDITVTDSVSPIADLSVPCGQVSLGGIAEHSVTVTNDGNANLVIGGVAVNDTLNDPFGISIDNCSGTTLSPAASCVVSVWFSPTDAGSFSDTFDIPTNDPDESVVTIAMSGSGVTDSVPDISVMDSSMPAEDRSLLCGDMAMGTSSDQTVTVSNAGSMDLTIGQVAGADPLLSPFSITTDGCSGTTLAPGASCGIGVSFSPGSPGAFNDSFDIPSNDPDEGSVTINVAGSGMTAGENNMPMAPVLVYPANGQDDVETSLTFRWRMSSDPDGDSLTYSLAYCDNPEFSGCLAEMVASSAPRSSHTGGFGAFGVSAFFVTVLAGSISGRRRIMLLMLGLLIAAGMLLSSCGGGGTTGQLEMTQSAHLDEGKTYYWKVIVDDGHGGTAESQVGTFVTED